MGNKTTQKSILFWTIIVIAIGLIVSLFLFRPEIYRQLDEWKLIPKNEPFTELYFDNYDALPKKTVAGQTTHITFTIHNLENSNMTYPYIVYFMDTKGQKTAFADNTVSLSDGDYKTITIPIAFSKSDENGKVVILLTQLNQQIDFLLPDNNQ